MSTAPCMGSYNDPENHHCLAHGGTNTLILQFVLTKFSNLPTWQARLVPWKRKNEWCLGHIPSFPLQDGLHREAEWPRKGVETRKTACVPQRIKKWWSGMLKKESVQEVELSSMLYKKAAIAIHNFMTFIHSPEAAFHSARAASGPKRKRWLMEAISRERLKRYSPNQSPGTARCFHKVLPSPSSCASFLWVLNGIFWRSPRSFRDKQSDDIEACRKLQFLFLTLG